MPTGAQAAEGQPHRATRTIDFLTWLTCAAQRAQVGVRQMTVVWASRRHSATARTAERYLSMSPTTKNIEPKMATMSATTQPVSTSGSTAMLLNDALRSFIRHGVFSPRETR